jgi:Lrp/AsnC family leucine-responsive transcriptional regulator
VANTLEITKLLDPIGWRILAELQDDARIHFSELGRRVGLSTPAVIKRVHRREEAGIITGYRVEIDRQKVGRPVCAFIRVRVIGNLISHVIAVAREMPEVYECHHITGEDTFLLNVATTTRVPDGKKKRRLSGHTNASKHAASLFLPSKGIMSVKFCRSC